MALDITTPAGETAFNGHQQRVRHVFSGMKTLLDTNNANATSRAKELEAHQEDMKEAIRTMQDDLDRVAVNVVEEFEE